MKEFIKMIRRYVVPYSKYLWGSVLMNVLSVVLNLFSFSLIVPILKILFSLDSGVYSFIPWDSTDVALKDILLNNLYYYVTSLIAAWGPEIGRAHV